MNETELIEKYVTEQGHTMESLVEKFKAIQACVFDGSFPIKYVDSYFDKKGDLHLYGLCENCYRHWEADKVGFRKKIMRKMEKDARKKKQDSRYDMSPYN